MQVEYTVFAALRELGHDLQHPCIGKIWVAQSRSRIKRYASRYFARDQRVQTHCGRVVSVRKDVNGIFMFKVRP